MIVVLVAVTGYMLTKIYVPTGMSSYQGNPGDNPLNIFMGKITDGKNLVPGTVEGFTTYDANCIGNDVTQCDAGIRTKEFGVLNFHYSHRMAVQPCLHMYGEEKVFLDILDSEGNAKITRTIATPSMDSMH